MCVTEKGNLQFSNTKQILPSFRSLKLSGFIIFAPTWSIGYFSQTQVEAEYRRSESKRVNTFVFIERVLGQIFALLIGLGGIIGGVYAAANGQPWAGGTIASLAITGLTAVFLTGRRGKS
jgi:hypothetical protein